jgi:hypothetical protein
MTIQRIAQCALLVSRLRANARTFLKSIEGKTFADAVATNAARDLERHVRRPPHRSPTDFRQSDAESELRELWSLCQHALRAFEMIPLATAPAAHLARLRATVAEAEEALPRTPDHGPWSSPPSLAPGDPKLRSKG